MNRMASSVQSSTSNLQFGSQSIEKLPKISEIPKDTLKKSLILIEHFQKIKNQRKEIKRLQKIESDIENRMSITTSMEQKVYDELDTVQKVRK